MKSKKLILAPVLAILVLTSVLPLIPVAVWHVAAQSCVQPPDGLISWWPGDGNANDVVGSNDGTLQNGAAFAPGKVGQAFSFDGPSEHVLIGNPVNLQLQDFTIDAWIKLDSLTIPWGGSIILGYGSGGYGYAVAGPDTTSLDMFLSKIGFSGAFAGILIPDTEWHHVAVTKSGSTVTFYLDGVSNVPSSYDPGFVFNTNIAIGIRPDNLDNGFSGLIDEVEVFDHALSAQEIQSIFNAGSAGKCKVKVYLPIVLKN